MALFDKFYPKNKKKRNLGPIDAVYAGPRQMARFGSRRDPMEEVYAGPPEPIDDEPTVDPGELPVEPERPSDDEPTVEPREAPAMLVYAGPQQMSAQFQNVAPMMAVYAGPQQMNMQNPMMMAYAGPQANGIGFLSMAEQMKQAAEKYAADPTSEPMVDGPDSINWAAKPKEEKVGVCPTCGAELFSRVKYCPECGALQEWEAVCPCCGATVAKDAKFCPECGYLLRK